MADPFSIITGALSLADICTRFVKFLKKAADDFSSTDEDILDLIGEIESLKCTNTAICNLVDKGNFSVKSERSGQIFLFTKTTLAKCQCLVCDLRDVLLEIVDVSNEKHHRYGQFRKWLKSCSKEEALSVLRKKIKEQQGILAMSIPLIQQLCFEEFQRENMALQRADRTASQAHHATTQALVGEVRKSINASSIDIRTRSPSPLNVYYDVPQMVIGIYTGRLYEMDQLRNLLIDGTANSPVETQRRFVIYGLPGSGKTQFCCKFASDNKQKFSAIFWVDASSKDRVKQSFLKISAIVKESPDELAAKNWLSRRGPDEPWLLIIDNADEQDLPIEECFPDNPNGVILITTRNPILRLCGTVGPRHFHFDGLEKTMAIELLLKAADEPRPWQKSSYEAACRIGERLGYLPLALVHAGKTVASDRCTLSDYLEDLKKRWDRIRHTRKINTADPDLDAKASIYATFEMIHDSLCAKNDQASRDALDLLKVLSFYHNQNIRLDIFAQAAENPSKDKIAEENMRAEERLSAQLRRRKLSWQDQLRTVGLMVIEMLHRFGKGPITPGFIPSDSLGINEFDDSRLRDALTTLSQMSLVSTQSDGRQRCSVHPAVHFWVRERPSMTLADQAVWCHMAANILTRAISLPTIADKEEDELFRRDILPHVQRVLEIKKTIQSMYVRNQVSRKRVWPVLQSTIDRDQAMQFVRFSIVLAQGGKLEEAHELQSKVAEVAETYLGNAHSSTMDIKRLLSKTCWQMGRPEKAADLQKQVLQACIEVRGHQDLKTLRVMDEYGSSLWLSGSFREALKLHENAVRGLQSVLGEHHADALRALTHLGRAYGRDFRFTDAIQIHSIVFPKLQEILGLAHLDTLESMECFGMSHYDRYVYGNGEIADLEHADCLQTKAYALRIEKLGKRHLITLWSGLNLARIRAARGKVDEAFSIFLPGHELARQIIGENHIGYLLGKIHHGRFLMHASRYEEAEKLIGEVVESHYKARKGHPDHLFSLFTLIKCRVLMGKGLDDDMFKELLEGTKASFGNDHVAVKRLRDPTTFSKETRIF